ncbi:MGMT family protein [Propioniciclava sinopodophylli]|uniref:MGMT family protein n=1 Tax=Propioniciclava sinopodophylli TaxID=1837344 RepID=UPI002492A275|nr:MGMT family protein [Propioniciclava sinopodophylli]
MADGPDAIARVLLAVAQVPPGRVASYGDIGAIAGVGPRQVGAILRDHGDAVPWWRIVSRDGVLVPLAKARPRWEAEGIEIRPDGRGCRMREFRADLAQLALDYRVASVESGA